MKLRFIKIILIFLSLFSFCMDGMSQSFIAEKNDSCIRNLKNGALIIRLQSDQKKLNYLNKLLIQSVGSNENQIKNVIDRTIRKRDEFNNALIEAFAEKYFYSDVFFIYDTAILDWKANNFDGRYLISVNDKKFNSNGFFLQMHKEIAEGQTIEYYKIKDSHGVKLLSPFPNSYQVYNFGSRLRSFVKDKNRQKRNAYRLARLINGKFERFHETGKKK